MNGSKEGGIQLNNGDKIPVLGIGSYDATGDELVEAIKIAIDTGYRFIDTAYAYKNEKEIGLAVNCKIKENVIKREDMYICTKLWNTFHRPDLVKKGFETALSNLQLGYIDLFLIHWPVAFTENIDEIFPLNQKQEYESSDVDIVDTWKAMIELLKTGLVRGIGVSNFNRNQLERILAASPYVPLVNQIECHPYLTQKHLTAYCASKNIHITAYSPLGSPNRPNVLTGEPNLFADANIIAMAKRHNRTEAQIMIRYQIQRHHSTIPKSVTPKRILSNFDVFKFFLSTDDMSLLDGLNYNRRMVPFVGAIEHKEYPFLAEY